MGLIGIQQQDGQIDRTLGNVERPPGLEVQSHTYSNFKDVEQLEGAEQDRFAEEKIAVPQIRGLERRVQETHLRHGAELEVEHTGHQPEKA